MERQIEMLWNRVHLQRQHVSNPLHVDVSSALAYLQRKRVSRLFVRLDSIAKIVIIVIEKIKSPLDLIRK